MDKIKSIMLFATMLLMMQFAKAQIPSNDSLSWKLQTIKSEEFNAAIDTVSKWFPRTSWGYLGGADVLQASNLTVSSGTIKIKVDSSGASWLEVPSKYNTTPSNGVHYVYQGGNIWSHYNAVSPDTTSYTYKYGYLELRAKFPTGSKSIWAAFWLFASDPVNNYYNEIDIVENTDYLALDGHMIGNNVHVNTTDDDIPNINFGYVDTVAPLLSSAFHKYALKWEPHSLTFYFDDVAVRTFYDADGDSIPQNKMPVIIGLGINPGFAWLPADWNNTALIPVHGNQPMSFPDTLEVDWFRYYKLGTECSTPLSNLCSPGGYNRTVKKSIATDNTCTITFNQSTANTSYTLRATDYVLLDAPTGSNSISINPSGTGYFAIEITACPE